jgi:hypothetical protein
VALEHRAQLLQRATHAFARRFFAHAKLRAHFAHATIGQKAQHECIAILSVEFRHEGENGDHNVSGMITTAMRLVNSVEAVVAAKPGLVTAADLPLVTGRGLVAR